MGRKPCCDKVGLKRGPWTAEEDHKLVAYITNSGLGCWRAIPKLAGLLRCGKSCRLRWTNYLRPDLKRGIFTEEEENLILDLHGTLGNRWSRIATQLPGRTDNEIKNYWNTRLKKRLRSQGLDPATHLPLDPNKLEGGTGDDSDDSPEGEDDDASDASGTKPEAKEAKKANKVKKASQPSEPAKLGKPVRQPRGPKPAPQLKMCESKDGPILVRVPNSPRPHTNIITTSTIRNPSPASSKCNDDDRRSEISSSSTVTTKSCAEDHHESTLACNFTSAPLQCSEAEIWQCIKPTAASTPLSSSTFLGEWDLIRHLDASLVIPCPILPNPKSLKFPEPSPQVMLDPVAGTQHDMMHFGSQDFVGENYGGIFEGTCFAQPEMAMSWSMDVEMGQPELECLFAPTPMALNPAGVYTTREIQQPASYQELQSQELQRLSALLDLI